MAKQQLVGGRVGVDLRLLGPIEVRGDGGLVGLDGARPTRLLVALYTAENQQLELEELVERCFDEGEMPRDPTAAIRTAVRRVRRALGDDVVVTRRGAYGLELAGVAVDVDQFAKLVAHGRAAADPVAAITSFGRAIDLWRGHPFGGLDFEWLELERFRLEELRLLALEGWHDAHLRNGSVTDILASLEATAATHPLRERFHRQLMHALFLADRQPEALRVFQDYREALVEAGLEPGPEMLDLERRIAVADSELRETTPGRRLRGYHIVERLGEGAFSVVYRGSQPSVDREVAIKQIRAELANRPEFIRRFDAEAHIVARLEHPYIVPLYDYWREPGSAYLVMRLLKGGSLQSSLLDSPWDSVRTLRMVQQVGQALATAHRAGVVHRDVKPANILLDGEGNAYLSDFGISLEAEEQTDPEAALSAGSPAYASPEQLRREPVGPSADVHGLAIVVYETLTGRLPFPDEPDQAALLQRQLHDPIPHIRASRGDIPSAIDDVVQTATAKDADDRYQTIEEFIAAVEPALGAASSSPQPARGSTTLVRDHTRNPFKGLRPFDEADAGDFAGRDRLIDQMVDSLASTRLLAVVGPSGSGKSSVVRAGLLPALRRGATHGSDQWFVAAMMPGSRPFEELEAALLQIAAEQPIDLLNVLHDGDRGISRALRRVVSDGNQVLLVIDQFEELFTLCDDETVRKQFLDGLSSAVSDERSRLRIVLTLRADFFDRPLRYESIGRLVRDGTIPVLPLAADELERAIVDPAASAGCEFEPGLVSEIVADVSDQPGSLPMLQYALTELYERRVSGLLTRDVYRRLGGVTGALAARAEELWSGSSPDEQLELRRLFGRLVTLGDGSEDTRRRVVRSELAPGPLLEAILTKFGEARLLTFDRDPSTREPTVEVAHEALIRQWPRLGAWLDEDRDGRRIQQHLTDSARAWTTTGRDDGDLYRAGRLETASAWAADHHIELNIAEQEFLAASLQLHRDEQDADRRQVRRLRRALVAVVIVASLALVAGALAAVQQRRADEAANRAEEQSARAQLEAVRADEAALRATEQAGLAETRAVEADLARMVAQSDLQLENDRQLALLIAAEAHHIGGSIDTLGGLQRALVGAPRGWLGALAGRNDYTHVDFVDDTTLVARGAGGIDIFDLTDLTLQSIDTAADDGATDASADGAAVAVGSSDGTWQMYDPTTWEVTAQGREAAPITEIAISPDGSLLAIGLQDGATALRDLISRDRNVEIPAGPSTDSVGGLAWGPASDRLVIGRGQFAPAGLYDTGSGQQIGADMAVGSLRGSGDVIWIGDTPVVTNGQLVRFDGTTTEPIGAPIIVRRTAVTSTDPAVAFDDDTVIYVGKTIEQINFESGIVTTLLEDQEVTFPRAAALSPDRSTLVVAHEDGLEMWSLSGQRIIATALPSVGPKINTNNDATLVTSSTASSFDTPGSTEVWDLATRTLLKEFDAEFAWIRGDAIMMLRTPRDGQLVPHEVWWPRDDRTARVPSSSLSTLGLSPDGRLAVSPTRTNLIVTVWDMESDELVAELRHLEQATAPEFRSTLAGTLVDAEFTSDGRRLIVTNRAVGAVVWDTMTWEVVQTVVGDEAFLDVDFTPDGNAAATLDSSGQITIRDPTDFSVRSGPTQVLGNPAVFSGKAVAIADDGLTLMASQVDGAFIIDAVTMEQIGGPFPHSGADAWSAQYASAANKLVTVVGDDIVIWDTNHDNWPSAACRAAGRNMTPEEWQEFGPTDRPYRATCSQWPALG